MDNNPDKVDQNEDPVFSSDQLANTKARAKKEYFTNVSKERPKLFRRAPSDTSNKKPSRRLTIILAALFALVLIAAVTFLFIFRPWEENSNQPNEDNSIHMISNLDIYEIYTNDGIESVNQYYDDIINDASTDSQVAIIKLDKLSFLVSNILFDDIDETVLDIKKDELNNRDLYRYYMNLYIYYGAKGDKETSESYFNAAMEIPGLDDIKLGGIS